MRNRPESPDVCDPYISDLVEKVLGLLEEAGIDTATNDQIVALIEQAEAHK